MEEQNNYTSYTSYEPEKPTASYQEPERTTSSYQEPTKTVSYSPAQPKRKTPAIFKIILAAVLGLCFGLCAALGIYAVNEVTGKSIFATTDETKVSELEKKIDNLQKQLGSQTVVTDTTDKNETVSQIVNIGNTYDVTKVVDAVMPSMVSVTNHGEEVFSSIWGQQYKQETESSGSGIIIGENDEEFLLVTNYHVVENCISLEVQLFDETMVNAYVKGFDSSVDIAVIAVKKEDLSNETKSVISIAALGDSDNLKIGEPAIAIGNALGYGQSVTTGVISALNRDIEMENSSHSLIQTSAAINPGNSGGALLNIDGEVVGINSSKIASAQIEGMGYAIPISQVRDIIEELSSRETKFKVNEDEKGYIGIQGATIDADASAMYGMPQGVMITKIYEDSAAANAGLNYGDVITTVDGQSISDLAMLQEFLNYYKAGDTVKVTVMRSNQTGYDEMEFLVTLSYKSSLVD